MGGESWDSSFPDETLHIYIFRSYLVGVKTGKIEKNERKIGWKMFGLGDKTRGKENGVENFPSEPTKFCPPNLGGKLRRKDDVGSKLQKYPHFFTLIKPFVILL